MMAPPKRASRYESQKRRDWLTFGHYLRSHRPPLELRRCSGAHVLEFLRYLDRFGKTRVHGPACPAYGGRPGTCHCPLRQAWGSLDALVGRLRAAHHEFHGATTNNPFAARAVRLYLREVRDAQALARGISYNNRRTKKRGARAVASDNQLTAPDLRPPPPLISGDLSGGGAAAGPAAACCFHLPFLFNSFGY